MNNRKDILLKILEAIGYGEDKEVFVSKFEKNIQLQAVADLIKSSPLEKQEEVKQKLSQNGGDAEKATKAIEDSFSGSQIQAALENAAKNAVIKYIEAIQNTLSDSQRENLSKILRELDQVTS